MGGPWSLFTLEGGARPRDLNQEFEGSSGSEVCVKLAFLVIHAPKTQQGAVNGHGGRVAWLWIHKNCW